MSPTYPDDVSDLNYETVAECDGCGKTASGKMLHTVNMYGSPECVLFLCFSCLGERRAE